MHRTKNLRLLTAPLFQWCVIALLPTLLLPAIAGCDQSRPPQRDHTFLIVGASQDDPLWPVLQGGARAYAQTVSQLKLKMIAPATRSPAAQADLVRENLDSSVFAVCLQATADNPTRQLVQELTSGGVSVVFIGEDMPDTGRIGYVGLDDYEAGRLLAEALRSNMHDRTTFMVLHAGEGNSPYGLRLRGFGVGMSAISHLSQLHQWNCQANTAQTREILTEQGRKYPDLGMWASIGNWPADIEPQQLRQALGQQTGVVMIGALPPVWPLMRLGIVRAAVATNYGWWGYEAVNLAELAFQRAQQPDKIRLTPPCILRPADLPQFQKDWDGWTQGQVLSAGSSATRPWAVTR